MKSFLEKKIIKQFVIGFLFNGILFSVIMILFHYKEDGIFDIKKFLFYFLFQGFFMGLYFGYIQYRKESKTH